MHVDPTDLRPLFFANDFSLTIRAVLKGLGVGSLPRMIGDPLVAQTRLVPILADSGLESVKFQLVWPPARHLAPRVRAFVDHAVAHVREQGLFAPSTTPY